MEKLRVIDSHHLAVVTAMNDFNPLHKLKNLSNELQLRNFCGFVILDLLYVNGLSDNRFVTLDFNGHDFDRSSFSVIADIDENIKKEQDRLFLSNPDILSGSVLSMDELNNF